MSKKKICYIDMDGVLADFEKTLYQLAPEIQLLVPGSKEKKAAVDNFCQSPAGRRLFLNLEPINGAIESFNLLCQHYDVVIHSTPMWEVEESYMDKRLWVGRVLGKIAEKRLMLSHRKELPAGHYLIDDRLMHGVLEFKGEHIHFGQEGFETWEKVIAYLRKKDNW